MYQFSHISLISYELHYTYVIHRIKLITKSEFIDYHAGRDIRFIEYECVES
jgi:hypothetical protein